MIGRNVTALAAIALLSSLTASAKTYSAESYTVTLNLTPQAQLEVIETVRFHFFGGPFTFVYRDLSAAETDGISGIEAWMDDQPAAVHIAGLKVRWRLADVVNETHTFRLRYTASGVIRKDIAGDTLIWRALPEKREYPIAAAGFHLSYPAGVTPVLSKLSTGRTLAVNGNILSTEIYNVHPSTPVILTARFAPGAFAVAPPRWQTEGARQREAFRTSAITAAPFALLALIGAWLWTGGVRSRYRRAAGASPAYPVLAPSSADLPPAIVAHLTGARGAIQGTLLDLARRGAVRIERTDSFWHRKKYRIVYSGGGVAQASFEREMLAEAFRRGPTVSLVDFHRRIGGSRAWRRELDAEMLRLGLIDPERKTARRRVAIPGGVLLFSAPVALVAAVVSASTGFEAAGAMAVAAAALLVAGILTVVTAARISPLTDAGTLAAAQWKGTAAYLRGVAKGSVALDAAAEWERLLPYAAAAGLAAALVKSRHAHLPIPEWFSSVDDIDGFNSFMTASDAASYYGGGDGGAGGGGGASGGGASGAG